MMRGPDLASAKRRAAMVPVCCIAVACTIAIRAIAPPQILQTTINQITLEIACSIRSHPAPGSSKANNGVASSRNGSESR